MSEQALNVNWKNFYWSKSLNILEEKWYLWKGIAETNTPGSLVLSYGQTFVIYDILTSLFDKRQRDRMISNIKSENLTHKLISHMSICSPGMQFVDFPKRRGVLKDKWMTSPWCTCPDFVHLWDWLSPASEALALLKGKECREFTWSRKWCCSWKEVDGLWMLLRGWGLLFEEVMGHLGRDGFRDGAEISRSD